LQASEQKKLRAFKYFIKALKSFNKKTMRFLIPYNCPITFLL